MVNSVKDCRSSLKVVRSTSSRCVDTQKRPLIPVLTLLATCPKVVVPFMLYYSELQEQFRRILTEHPEEYQTHQEHGQLISIVHPGTLAPAEKKWERFQIGLWSKLQDSSGEDWRKLVKIVDDEFRKFTK